MTWILCVKVPWLTLSVPAITGRSEGHELNRAQTYRLTYILIDRSVLWVCRCRLTSFTEVIKILLTYGELMSKSPERRYFCAKASDNTPSERLPEYGTALRVD